jgi:hypothetical protein
MIDPEATHYIGRLTRLSKVIGVYVIVAQLETWVTISLTNVAIFLMDESTELIFHVNNCPALI